jgi:hypothetical protein
MLKKLLLACLALAVLAGVIVIIRHLYAPPEFQQYMRTLQARGLSRVEFEPGWDYEPIQTNDPQFLTELAEWLPSLREPNPDYSLKQFSFPLVLVFKDGSREELKFSGAPSSLYVLIYWRGRRYWGWEDPFTAFLQRPKGAALLKKRPHPFQLP